MNMIHSLNKHYNNEYKKISKLLEKKELNYYFYVDADMFLYQYVLECQRDHREVEDAQVVLQRLLTPMLVQTKGERWMSYFIFPLLLLIFSLILKLFLHKYMISSHYVCGIFLLSFAFDLIFIQMKPCSLMNRCLVSFLMIVIGWTVMYFLPMYEFALSFVSIFVIIMLSCVFLLCIHNHFKRVYVDWKNNL